MKGIWPRVRAVAARLLHQALMSPRVASWSTALAAVAAAAALLAFPGNTFSLIFLLLVILAVYLAALQPWQKVAYIAPLLLVVVPLAGVKNEALTSLFIYIFINVALALGLNVVVGFAGLLDLGYIAFYAGGAYLYAIFGSAQAREIFKGLADMFPFGGWWFWMCLPMAVAFAAFLGVALGVPVLRLRGDYLAIVTLGFGEIIYVLAKNLDKPINITGGSFGIGNIQTPVLFGMKLNKEIHFYFIGLVFAVLTAVAIARLERSRIGRAWAAMREDEVAARAMGVPLVQMKLLAFATGASFSGAMGMLFAVKQQFINPDTFTFVESIGILAMVILGGLGSIPGAIAGAVTVTVLRLQILQKFSEWVQQFNFPTALDPAKYQPLIFGLILIVMMLYRQQGLFPARRKPEDIEAIEGVALPAPVKARAGAQVQP